MCVGHIDAVWRAIQAGQLTEAEARACFAEIGRRKLRDLRGL